MKRFNIENFDKEKRDETFIFKRNNDKRFKYIITEYLGSEIG